MNDAMKKLIENTERTTRQVEEPMRAAESAFADLGGLPTLSSTLQDIVGDTSPFHQAAHDYGNAAHRALERIPVSPMDAAIAKHARQHQDLVNAAIPHPDSAIAYVGAMVREGRERQLDEEEAARERNMRQAREPLDTDDWMSD